MSLAPRPRPTHSTTHVSTIESQEEGKRAARGGRATGFDDDPLKRCSDGAQVELGDAVCLGFRVGLVLCLVKGGGARVMKTRVHLHLPYTSRLQTHTRERACSARLRTGCRRPPAPARRAPSSRGSPPASARACPAASCVGLGWWWVLLCVCGGGFRCDDGSVVHTNEFMLTTRPPF